MGGSCWPGNCETDSTHMKTQTLKSVLSGLLALGAGAVFSSCVDNVNGSRPHASHHRSGQVVRELPGGYRTETIGGSTYYSHGGTYFRRHNGGFIVVDTPRQRPGPPHKNHTDQRGDDHNDRRGLSRDDDRGRGDQRLPTEKPGTGKWNAHDRGDQ